MILTLCVFVDLINGFSSFVCDVSNYLRPKNNTETVAMVALTTATILASRQIGLSVGAPVAVTGLVGIALLRNFAKEKVQPPNSLMEKTIHHKTLMTYHRSTIPANTKIILTSFVIDGVGDLEHLVHCARRLLKGTQAQNIQLSVWLARGDNVPEVAFQSKLQELVQLGCKTIYISPLEGKIRLAPSDSVFLCDADGNYDESHSVPVSDVIEKMKTQKDLPNVINISHDFPIPDRAMPTLGRIDEYGKEYGSSLDVLLAGFRSGTFGVWISDDPVFSAKDPLLSQTLKSMLLGSEEADLESWEIGHASLREDDARLAWMNLRLRQVSFDKNCALAISPFKNVASKEKICELAQQHGFDRCILVNRDGSEVEILSSMDSHPRTLRIVHGFIAEDDLPALFHFAGKGILGGAGDTSCIRGLKGSLPVLVEHRNMTEERWALASQYLVSKDFPKLSQWFEACSNARYDDLQNLITPELIEEWDVFRSRAIEELDIGPWIDLYVKYCVLSASNESGW